MIWLQKLLILLLNPFARLSSKIEDKTKEKLRICILVAICILPYIWYTLTCAGYVLSGLIKMLQEVALIIIYILLCLEYPLHLVDWRKWIIAAWFAFGALIFLMGFISKQNPGYWMSGLVFAIGFPAVYFVLMQTDYYRKHLQYMAKILLVISTIYFVVTAIAAPIISPAAWSAGRYNGIAFDCNRLGEFGIIAFCCGLYILFDETSKFWKILAAIVTGISVGMIILTQSRTALLAIVLIAVLWAISLIRNWKRPGKNAVVLFLIVLVFTGATYGLLQAQHRSELRASMQASMPEDATEDVEIVIDEGDVLDRVESSGGNLDSYSSGRLRIWGNYAKHFNLTGNERLDESPIEGEDRISNAHNNTVEFTYRSGICAGLIYVIIQFCMLVFVIKTAFTKGVDRTTCFAASACIGFGIFTNLMTSYNPLYHAMFLFVLMVQIPIFVKKEKKETEAKSDKKGSC